jgi:hypothetical protein
MRSRLQRCLTLLALYAVAAHVILLGFAPVNAGAFSTLDPFALICHTTGPAAAPGEPPPGTIHFIPGRAIDQCTLASAAASPPVPDFALPIDFAFGRILHVLRPAPMSARAGLTSDPKLARAPPLFA